MKINDPGACWINPFNPSTARGKSIRSRVCISTLEFLCKEFDELHAHEHCSNQKLCTLCVINSKKHENSSGPASGASAVQFIRRKDHFPFPSARPIPRASRLPTRNEDTRGQPRQKNGDIKKSGETGRENTCQAEETFLCGRSSGIRYALGNRFRSKRGRKEGGLLLSLLYTAFPGLHAIKNVDRVRFRVYPPNRGQKPAGLHTIPRSFLCFYSFRVRPKDRPIVRGMNEGNLSRGTRTHSTLRYPLGGKLFYSTDA